MRRPSNTRRPAIHSGEGASTRGRVFALSNNLDGLFDGVRAGHAQWQWAVDFESHSWRERDNSSSAVAEETGELPQSSWNFRELHN